MQRPVFMSVPSGLLYSIKLDRRKTRKPEKRPTRTILKHPYRLTARFRKSFSGFISPNSLSASGT